MIQNQYSIIAMYWFRIDFGTFENLPLLSDKKPPLYEIKNFIHIPFWAHKRSMNQCSGILGINQTDL